MSVVPQVFHSGDLCGQYRIRRLFAAGGIAQVYEGVHPFTGRKVAIKVLSLSHATDEVFQARMKAEAQLLTELTHPNIVTVCEANMTPEGVVWICTELVYGRTLRQWLDDEGPFEVADALYILRETAKGIAAAHELRTVHHTGGLSPAFVADLPVMTTLKSERSPRVEVTPRSQPLLAQPPLLVLAALFSMPSSLKLLLDQQPGKDSARDECRREVLPGSCSTPCPGGRRAGSVLTCWLLSPRTAYLKKSADEPFDRIISDPARMNGQPSMKYRPEARRWSLRPARASKRRAFCGA